MSRKEEFLSWDDDDIPWNDILEFEVDFEDEFDEEMDQSSQQEIATTRASGGRHDDGTIVKNKENVPPKTGKRKASNGPTKPPKKKSDVATDDVNYVCPKCPKKHKTISGFRKHSAQIHGDTAILASNNTIGSHVTEVPLEDGDKAKEIDMIGVIKQAVLPALLCVVTSTILNLQSAVCGTEIVNMAKKLVQVGEEERCTLNDLLCANFLTVFSMRKYACFGTSNMRERFFSDYNSLLASRDKMKSIRAAVKVALGEASCTDHTIHHFVNCYMRRIVLVTISKLASSCETNCDSKVHDLSDNDQSVLFFIAGYILRNVKGLCAKRKNLMLSYAADAILEKNNVCDRAFVKRFTLWTKHIDRGRLICPCDDFFLLVREFETALRKHVNLERLTSLSLVKSKLTEILLESFMVNYYWDRLCSVEQSCVKEVLLEMIILKFPNVRGYAVTRHARTKSKISNMSEKPLRQALKKKNN